MSHVPDIERDVQLRDFNTLRLHANATGWVNAASTDAIVAGVHAGASSGLPVIPLGEGSNVVLPELLNALVVRVSSKGIKRLKDDGRHVRLRVAAGENWHRFVVWCVEEGLFGLENLALIPGTVGAAPVQNIGAYGVEVSNSLRGVEVVDLESGAVDYLGAEECDFAYRYSVFKEISTRRWIIASVDFELDRQAPVHHEYPALADRLPSPEPSHRDVMEAVIAIRRERLPDPVTQPNAGSFFKNPEVTSEEATSLAAVYPDLPQFQAGERVKLSAAWLIERAGWRGTSVSGVCMSSQHALVLVNESADTASELLAFASQVQQSVQKQFGVELSIEPDVL